MGNLDVLFVHTNSSKEVYQSLASEFSAIEPPIWAALLANGIHHRGYKTAVLDAEVERYTAKETAEKAHELDADLVVVVVYGQQPSASTQNMVGANAFATEYKAVGHGKVMLVGAHPSALPQQTLKDNYDIDFVARGEGLYTILDYLEKPAFSEMRGLWWRQYSSNAPIGDKNYYMVPQEKLEEELPGIDWSMLPSLEKYRTGNWHAFPNNGARQPFASLYTSLGCPFKCSFCMINAPFGGPSYRCWSPEFVVDELQKLSDMGVKNVKIADEMFVLKETHYLRICELIIERGLDLNIWAYARIDTVKDKYLETLKKAGVNWLALGIESGNTEVRKDVVKGRFEDTDIRSLVAKIKASGINVIGNFIFGLPEDTIKSMAETYNLAKELNCEMVNFYCAMAYPGSQLYRDAIKEDYPLPENWEGYSQHSYECFPLNTKYVPNTAVLAFRDASFDEYFSDYNTDYYKLIREKFGAEIDKNLQDMRQHQLDRKLLDEN